MVRSNTFEIRWHETQPIYSCSFQAVAAPHLRRILDYNYGQGEYAIAGTPWRNLTFTHLTCGTKPAAGLAPDKTFASDVAQTAGPSTRTSQRVDAPLDIAGGQNWRLATAGGDNKVRVSTLPSLFPLPRPSPTALRNWTNPSRTSCSGSPYTDLARQAQHSIAQCNGQRGSRWYALASPSPGTSRIPRHTRSARGRRQLRTILACW